MKTSVWKNVDIGLWIVDCDICGACIGQAWNWGVAFRHAFAHTKLPHRSWGVM